MEVWYFDICKILQALDKQISNMENSIKTMEIKWDIYLQTGMIENFRKEINELDKQKKTQEERLQELKLERKKLGSLEKVLKERLYLDKK